MRVREAQQLFDVPPAQRRPTMPLGEIQGRRRLYNLEQREQIAKIKRRTKSNVPWARVAGFGLLAVLLGGTVGWGFANSDRMLAAFHSRLYSVQATLAALTLPVASTAPHNTETVINKKPSAIGCLGVQH